jgi:hypothetical protein
MLLVTLSGCVTKVYETNVVFVEEPDDNGSSPRATKYKISRKIINGKPVDVSKKN